MSSQKPTVFFYRGQEVTVLEGGRFSTKHLGEAHIFSSYHNLVQFIDWTLGGHKWSA